MSKISVTVDGAATSIEADQKPTQIFSESKEIVVCKVNGVLRDLWTDLSDGDVVEGVSISSADGLSVLRHSTAHVMAQAVQQVFAQTRLGIGPPITDGFYYDFDPANPFNPDDLEKIESAMRKIIKDGQRFKRRARYRHPAREGGDGARAGRGDAVAGGVWTCTGFVPVF